MRIAILNKYQDKVMRGAETFVFELGKRLSEKHSVDVISNINYFDIFKKRYDLIIPTNGRYQAIAIKKIVLLTGAKVIISGQSGIGLDDRINLYTFPNVFVALSSKALAWAKKVNPAVKSVYIPNGVDLDKFKAIKKETNKNTKTVLAVGAFTEQKRLDLVIKAISKLPNVNLVIAGGGGDLKQKITDYGMSILGKDRFEVISVPFEKMPEVYASADIFTLPSATSESFGNVLIEAMATNLPVVATDDPVRREIVGEAGIFVDPTNTEVYAAAIKTALEKDWGDAPRKQAEKFSWDEIAKKYEKLIEEIIK